MIQTENKCIWLKIGHISYCDKPCVKKNKYCSSHMQSIRNGRSGPKPCIQCFVGFRGSTQLCAACGGKKYRELKRYYDKKIDTSTGKPPIKTETDYLIRFKNNDLDK